MAALKTRPTKASVKAFIDGIDNEQKRTDCRAVASMMRRATGKRAKMWGDSMVGYGSYHYRYASGQEGDWFLTGFAPRKQALTLYIMAGFSRYDKLLEKLGKFKTGKSCLYIKRLDDVDTEVLQALIDESVACIRERYPAS